MHCDKLLAKYKDVVDVFESPILDNKAIKDHKVMGSVKIVRLCDKVSFVRL